MMLNANKSQSHSNARNKKLGKLPDFYLPEWMNESPIKSTRSGGSFAEKYNPIEIEANKLDINRQANEKDNSLQLKFKFTSGKEENHHSGVSARTPTPDHMKQIEEQSEGSSSPKNNRRFVKKGNGPRMSEHISNDRHKEILNELGIPQDERNTNIDRKEHQANS